MRVQNNPRNSGVSHNKQTNSPMKSASIADLQKTLEKFQGQLREKQAAGDVFGAKMRQRMIDVTQAQIAELTD